MNSQLTIQEHLNLFGKGITVSNLCYTAGDEPTFTTQDGKYTYSFHIYIHSFMKIMDNKGCEIIFIVDGGTPSITWKSGNEDAIHKMIDDVKSEVLDNKHHNILAKQGYTNV